jgi:hypothetical protein
MENFYLEESEELFSIIDRVRRSHDNKIVLVVPRGLFSLRSIINLRIIKEESLELQKDVSIVTSDALIKKLTQQAGLRILEEVVPKNEKDVRWPQQLKEAREIEIEPVVGSKKKILSDIINPRNIVNLKKIIHEPKPELEPEIDEIEFTNGRTIDEVDEEQEKSDIIYEPRKKGMRFKFFTPKKVIAFFIFIALLVIGFLLYFVLPNAQIIVVPQKESAQFESEVAVDKNTDAISSEDNSIPGQVFELEVGDSRIFPSTGEKNVEEKAKGVITVYNQYSSSSQTLVKSTRFRSSDNKIFRLIDNEVIPGAIIEEGKIIPSSKDVEVIADETGESYNIGPSDFVIPGFEGTPKYASFYGKSAESMTGGAKGKVKVATKEDIDGAIAIVSAELKNKAKEEFDKKIPANLKIMKEAQIVEVSESKASLKPDQPGREFSVTVKAKAWGMAFDEKDVLSLIEKNISDKISENKVLIPSTIKIDYKSLKIDNDRSNLYLSCQVEADVAWKLNQDEIKKNLLGRNEIEVRKYLSSLTEIDTARVVFWPFWVNKIPDNKNKIKIIIENN